MGTVLGVSVSGFAEVSSGFDEFFAFLPLLDLSTRGSGTLSVITFFSASFFLLSTNPNAGLTTGTDFEDESSDKSDWEDSDTLDFSSV